jgi:hypothetical protein
MRPNGSGNRRFARVAYRHRPYGSGNHCVHIRPARFNSRRRWDSRGRRRGLLRHGETATSKEGLELGFAVEFEAHRHPAGSFVPEPPNAHGEAAGLNNLKVLFDILNAVGPTGCGDRREKRAIPPYRPSAAKWNLDERNFFWWRLAKVPTKAVARDDRKGERYRLSPSTRFAGLSCSSVSPSQRHTPKGGCDSL